MAITQLGFHETLVNNIQDQINPAINDTATTITIGDASDLPTQGFFRGKIDNELILFDGRSGNVLNVATGGRGIEGTTAVSHALNAEIKIVATEDGLRRFLLDHRAPAFTGESTVVSMPHNRILDGSNSVLTVSDFTWVNQGSATATDLKGAIYMTIPDEANHNLRGLVLTAPSTPYRIICKIQLGIAPGVMDNNGTHAGLWMRESSTGKLMTASLRYGGRMSLWRWTNTTTFSAVVDTSQSHHEDAVWIQFEDDGTELKSRYSHTGGDWSRTDNSWWQDNRTDFMAGGPNQVGFYLNSGTNSGNVSTGSALCHATFESFRVEEL